MEIPVQICLIVELFITIVESSLVLRQPEYTHFLHPIWYTHFLRPIWYTHFLHPVQYTHFFIFLTA